MCIFLLPVRGFLVVVYFLFSWLVNWGFRPVCARTFILDNTIPYEKKISILIVIADPE